MYLENIHCPNDIKSLNIEQLNILCDEIRQKLIETVSKNGGHLASNLGVVELTVGIHYVFDSPNDSVLFDVGHQCYVHKLLTGRFDRFDTIRTEDGLSGFMFPPESEHDAFVSGHSSNSLSAAFGIAKANSISNNDNYVVPVVGDGALTGGMIFEALNNSGRCRDKMIVVVNDNQMSISRNVGSLARHLTSIRIGKRYIRTKQGIRRFLDKTLVGRFIGKLMFKTKQMLKSALYNCNYFESLGYYYMGPIDGNNISDVIKVLRSARDIKKPVVVHAITKKGHGFKPAEKNPTSYHGVSNFDINVGVCSNDNCFSSIFGDKLCELAKQDNKICAITAAMTEGTGLVRFKEQFNNRFFDVGIAEQHAVTFSAGLAAKGFKPVFAVYSSFLQRAYDQLVHDVAVCKYNVTIAVDRAGIVGEDGVTHQGIFDVAFLNSIPNIEVYSPSYYSELNDCLDYAIQVNGPAVVRYPRGKQGYKPEWYNHSENAFDIYERDNSSSVAVTYGKLFCNVSKASDISGFSVCKLNCIKPITTELIQRLKAFDRIVFFEEGILCGGVAQAVGSMLAQADYKGEFIIKAIDGFVPHSSIESAFKRYGFDVDSITKIMNGDNVE